MSQRQQLATATIVDNCDAFSSDLLSHQVSFTKEPLLPFHQIGQMIPTSEVHNHLAEDTSYLHNVLANQL